MAIPIGDYNHCQPLQNCERVDADLRRLRGLFAKVMDTHSDPDRFKKNCLVYCVARGAHQYTRKATVDSIRTWVDLWEKKELPVSKSADPVTEKQFFCEARTLNLLYA